jgi:hypothetical protein
MLLGRKQEGGAAVEYLRLKEVNGLEEKKGGLLNGS